MKYAITSNRHNNAHVCESLNDAIDIKPNLGRRWWPDETNISALVPIASCDEPFVSKDQCVSAYGHVPGTVRILDSVGDVETIDREDALALAQWLIAWYGSQS